MKLVDTLELEVQRGTFRACLFEGDPDGLVAVTVDLESASAVNVYERLAKAIYDEMVATRDLDPEGMRIFAYHPGAPVEWAATELRWHPQDERYSTTNQRWIHPSTAEVRELVGPALDPCLEVEE